MEEDIVAGVMSVVRVGGVMMEEEWVARMVAA